MSMPTVLDKEIKRSRAWLNSSCRSTVPRRAKPAIQGSLGEPLFQSIYTFDDLFRMVVYRIKGRVQLFEVIYVQAIGHASELDGAETLCKP